MHETAPKDSGTHPDTWKNPADNSVMFPGDPVSSREHPRGLGGESIARIPLMPEPISG